MISRQLFWAAYESGLRDVFKHHPRCDEILSEFRNGIEDFDLIDRYFAEADHYGWEWLSKLAQSTVKGKTVTFKIVRDGDDA